MEGRRGGEGDAGKGPRVVERMGQQARSGGLDLIPGDPAHVHVLCLPGLLEAAMILLLPDQDAADLCPEPRLWLGETVIFADSPADQILRRHGGYSSL